MSLIRLDANANYPLHNVASTRAIEQAAAAQLPPNTLMQRAGLAVARLACALAPRAQIIWVACGPGNNGGDGLEAAMHLQTWGHHPIVTWLGDEATCPDDSRAALTRARQAGVSISTEPPAQCDLAIDALLGIGVSKPLSGQIAAWLTHMHRSAATVLCVDVPSGLSADTGCYAPAVATTESSENAINNRANYPINTPAIAKNEPKNSLFCLSLLTLKPGLFTAQGKDAAGQVWFDDLGVSEAVEAVDAAASSAPTAWLLGSDCASSAPRPHTSHKGSFGDVAVMGGAASMTGAALLAARAALHAGAGRIFVALLDGGSLSVDPLQPELMFRSPDAVNLRDTTIVCGCGGGDAVRHILPRILSLAKHVVLDADALNAIAQDTQLQTLLTARNGYAADRGFATILTPHPLEAARLLGCTTAQVQTDRLWAAQRLASQYQCVVVLKGAGTVLAAPQQTPCINASGNAKLATAGTGDVLAGLVGAQLAASHANGQTPFEAACAAVSRHGQVADAWDAEASEAQTLTASVLAQRI